MPISEEGTITEGPIALELFADRMAERRCFLRYLNEEHSRDKILFFHGDGGNGKSLLLLLLRDRYCRRLPEAGWQYLENLDDDKAFIKAFDAVAKNSLEIPVTYIKFDSLEKDGKCPREVWNALLILRRDLGVHKLKFPLFDFAIVLFLHARHELSSQQIKALFPEEEADLITGLIELITDPETPGVGLPVKILNIINKRLKSQITLWKAKRGLNEKLVREIQAFDPNSELIAHLPKIFARDLNASLQMTNAPRRVVLLFDSHESFWGTERHIQSLDSYFQRDEWLRSLLNELYEPNYGVVAVIAGREPPRWSEADKASIPAGYIDAKFVGHLERVDAENYLQRAFAPTKIDDPELHAALIRYTEMEHNQVHPLYLGLIADVVLQAHKQGTVLTASEFIEEPDTEKKNRYLINRLLRYCGRDVAYAVKVLATARAFDWELFHTLGDQMNYHATKPAFDTLIEFSFIWQDSQHGKGWYRIHDLLRRVLGTLEAEESMKAHAALEAIYRKSAKSNPNALVEAIYHANQQDWERGANEWLTRMVEASNRSHFDFAGKLIELQPELRLHTFWAQANIMQAIGEHRLNMSLYQTALINLKNSIDAYDKELEYTLMDEVDIHVERGNVLLKVGELYSILTKYQEAGQAFQDTIAAYDMVLEHVPDFIISHINKGLALLRLGELFAARSEHQKASQAYYDAIVACDKSLEYKPDSITAHINKGSALMRLAELYSTLSKYSEARQAYHDGISACNKALEYAPDSVDAHMSKGFGLLRFGELYSILTKYQEAGQAYHDAISACDKGLEYAPNSIKIHINKGGAFGRLGELNSTLGKHKEAKQNYHVATSIFNKALKFAPDNPIICMSMGNVLLNLGKCHLVSAEYQEAEQAYYDAILACDEALEYAPNFQEAYLNKGSALTELGKLYFNLSNRHRAGQAIRDAIATYDKVLEHMPVFVDALTNKALCLLLFADLQYSDNKTDESCEKLHEAKSILDYVRQIAPNNKFSSEMIQILMQIFEQRCCDCSEK